MAERQITHEEYMRAGYLALVLDELTNDDVESCLPPSSHEAVLQAALTMALWLPQHCETNRKDLENAWEGTALIFSAREMVPEINDICSDRWIRAWACGLCLPLWVDETPGVAWCQEWTPQGSPTTFYLRRVYRTEQDQDWNIITPAHSKDPGFRPHEQEFRLYADMPGSVALRCVMTSASYEEIRINISAMMTDPVTEKALPIRPEFLREAVLNAPSQP